MAASTTTSRWLKELLNSSGDTFGPPLVPRNQDKGQSGEQYTGPLRRPKRPHLTDELWEQLLDDEDENHRQDGIHPSDNRTLVDTFGSAREHGEGKIQPQSVEHTARKSVEAGLEGDLVGLDHAPADVTAHEGHDSEGSEHFEDKIDLCPVVRSFCGENVNRRPTDERENRSRHPVHGILLFLHEGVVPHVF